MRKNTLTSLLSLFTTAAFITPLLGQDTDPFVKKPSQATPPVASGGFADNETLIELDLPQNIHITYEVFSVPIAEAPKLCRGGFTHKSIYNALTNEPEKHSANLETFESIMVLPGQRATNESISELIYPTEYEPAQLPSLPEKIVELKIGEKPLAVPAVPTAYDTRKIGITVEVEAQIGHEPRLLPLNQKGAELLKSYYGFKSKNEGAQQDPFADSQTPQENPFLPKISAALKKGDLKAVTYIEATISPIHVERVKDVIWGKDLSETAMPSFDVQSIKTGVTLVSGEPTLLGTMNPHPESKKHADGKRVWFAFVTASAMKAGR